MRRDQTVGEEVYSVKLYECFATPEADIPTGEQMLMAREHRPFETLMHVNRWRRGAIVKNLEAQVLMARNARAVCFDVVCTLEMEQVRASPMMPMIFRGLFLSCMGLNVSYQLCEIHHGQKMCECR